jgi:hypothetical protein
MLAVAGCAALSPQPPTPQQRAAKLEPMLSAAGFKMTVATTDQRKQQLAAMPQLSLKYYPDKNGNPKYWFADAQFCNCLYTGDQTAYAQYKQMRFQQHLASEQQQTAQEQMEAAQEEQMDMMNPWGYGPMWGVY